MQAVSTAMETAILQAPKPKTLTCGVRRELAELIAGGIGMHHAGMLRSDRNLVERLFRDGILKVTD